MNRDQALKLFEPYENILFDFGGIFLDLDFQKTVTAFQKLGSPLPFDQLYSKQNQTELFELLETGRIQRDEFFRELKKLLSLHHCSEEELTAAWNAMLLEMPSERLDFLKELRSTKKIFMLSNINEIHEHYLDDYFRKSPAVADFYSHFDRVYFSHRIGLRKPHRNAFEFVCADAGLDPARTLFLDDSIQHIETARQCGLATHHLDPANTFIVQKKRIG